MNNKMKEILILAAQVIVSRSGDVVTDDGIFATTDISDLLYLQMAIADAFDLDSDDVELKDMNRIRNVVKFDMH
jgi:hypothetical protein